MLSSNDNGTNSNAGSHHHHQTEYCASLSPCYYHVNGWAKGIIPVSEPCKVPKGSTNSSMDTKCSLCCEIGGDYPCIQISFGYYKELAFLVSFAGRDWTFNGTPIQGLPLDNAARAQLSRCTTPEQRKAGFRQLAQRIAEEFRGRYPFVDSIYGQHTH